MAWGGPRLRIFPNGLFSLFLLAGTGLAFKLHRDDIRRMEEESDRPINDLTEEELLMLMKELGIKVHDPGNNYGTQIKLSTKEELEQIEKLAELLYKGFITDEEYQAKKRQILGLNELDINSKA